MKYVALDLISDSDTHSIRHSTEAKFDSCKVIIAIIISVNSCATVEGHVGFSLGIIIRCALSLSLCVLYLLIVFPCVIQARECVIRDDDGEDVEGSNGNFYKKRVGDIFNDI